SEIKALLAADVKTTVDAQAVSDFLSLMYVPGSRSVFAEVSKLPPASVLVWDDDGYRVHRYWDLAQRARPAPVRAAAARHRLRELITASVDAQLAADVPVGFFLSGGVDSGTVVAAARAARPDQELRTFSVGFTDPSYDERRAAAAVARRFGCRHTDLVVRPRADDIAGGMATSFDEPFADPSMIPTYYLCRLARAHVTVALSGDGGDELFAGYATYQADKLARYYRRLPRTLTAGAVPALVGLLPRSERRMPLSFRARRFADNAVAQPGRSHYLWRVVLSEQRKAALLHPDVAAGLEDTYATHEPHYRDGAHLDPLTRFQYTDARVYLVDDVLTKVDRASMAHSLEVRVPLLATPVVEYAFSLPGRLKMPGLRTKKLLRDAMRGTLPPGVLRARKRGFNAPLAQWLRTDLRPLVEDFLAPDLVRRHGYLRAPAISAMVGRHLRADADHSRELWAALVLSMWAERHGAPR
ncbi:MAG TPA: asparagine synthase C-terminal domain-containing protein, partial [Pilimelia sp.]|nr:asparagine synthase C-terminal domain-containing protein [Pilimelia sp.]